MEEIRRQVGEFCRRGDFTGAIKLAMKSWKSAELEYGREHPVTAEYMIIFADAAKYAQKFHLAEAFYTRALAIKQKALGISHPDVERCRISLTDLVRNAHEYD